jgi:hypothetical protein
MVDRNGDKVDIRRIKGLYGQAPANKAALDYFAARQKNSAKTTVDRLLAALRQEGHDVPRADIIELFKALEEAKCGAFVVGRKGHPTRFEWSASLVSVGRAATGEVGEIEALSEAEEEELEDDAASAELISHRFVLRPDFEVQLQLPSDLTAVEASRLSEFVRTLPFAR